MCLAPVSTGSIVPPVRPIEQSGEHPMNMNSTKTRVVMGLTLAIVGLTGAFAVKNGLAEIQRLTPAPEITATAVAASHPQPVLKSEVAATENAPTPSAEPVIEPDPFAEDAQVPHAEITTVVAKKRLEPIPETEEFHSRIYRGTTSEDVTLPLNESAPTSRDPE
jgi:hypothetical protein